MDTEALKELTKDLKKAVLTMTPDEARFLVDSYYQMQDNRIRADGQIRSMEGEPHAVLLWLSENAYALECQVRSALNAYAKSQHMGRWSLEVVGIGPVLSAGLLAHIDIEKAPTVGHIWNFAGLNPDAKWEKGQKRPWNASLKVLCFKIGESFVKVSGNEKSVYGKIYAERKLKEIADNLIGKFADKAGAALKAKNWSDDALGRKWYEGCYTADIARQILSLDPGKRMDAMKKLAGKPGSGTPMLPPAHVHARSKRYAVKIFLSHWHAEAWWARYGTEPPKPFAIGVLGHGHFIAPEVGRMARTEPDHAKGTSMASAPIRLNESNKRSEPRSGTEPNSSERASGTD